MGEGYHFCVRTDMPESGATSSYDSSGDRFIALYKSFPCIWRVKSREYSDRNKEACESLVKKFKEIHATATLDFDI
ncbi:unnamed protein product [Acanthoscelides obtectus]|uniref:Uncharacterized protein n=1 Tax=Acanthoscelides obtectus TaxID=200917 RepID=A0A9P0KVE6_ACAOB|nr:unnamed protein product [Acanthoscelides obtectus]CAK1681931.1 hypothetical protein AOBTE_LOCUS33339 [Acanthoscelides obtectus]